MNREQFKGLWNQLKGELKKQWGKFTDDDLLQIEGDYDKFIGKVQERYGERKDEISRWMEQWQSSLKSKDNPDARKAS